MTKKPHAPEWLFLVALGSISFLAQLGFTVTNMSAMPVFLKTGMHLVKLTGFALGIYYLVEALANSPMGTLADRVGRRRMMVTGTCISIVTCLLTLFLRTPAPDDRAMMLGISAIVLLLRACDGFGAAMLWPSVYASVSDRIAPERQGQATTVIIGSYMAAIPLGMKIGGYLDDHAGQAFPATDARHYAASFYFAAACFLATAVLAFFTAPRRSAEHHAPKASDAHAAVSFGVLVGTFKKMPGLLGLISLIFVAVGLIAPYVKPYFMERFNLSEEAFGNQLIGPAILLAILTAPLGKVADKWGKPLAIQLGVAFCAVSIWGIHLIPPELKSLILLFGTMLGLGFIVSFPAYMAFVADQASEKERGGTIGAVRMAQGIGAMVGTVLSSPLSDLDSDHKTIFIVAASLLTISFALSLLLIRTKKT
jgi:MFS transporter, DHA1 family, multidrug resistance protein